MNIKPTQIRRDAFTTGAGNYFRSRATLSLYLSLADHILVKGYDNAKKIGLCGPDVARGPYVAPPGLKTIFLTFELSQLKQTWSIFPSFIKVSSKDEFCRALTNTTDDNDNIFVQIPVPPDPAAWGPETRILQFRPIRPELIFTLKYLRTMYQKH